MWAEILIVAALIALNGFFAMSELALISSRSSELRRLAEEGSRGAEIALGMLADPSRMLSVVQTGITLVGIVAGAYSGATVGAHFSVWLSATTPQLGSWAPEIAMTVVVGGITYLSLVIGELVPKRIALRHAEFIAVRVAPIMHWVAIGGSPVVGLLQLSTNGILRLLGQNPQDTRAVTGQELRALIAEGALVGAIQPSEKDMLDRVLRLTDRPVGSIMTPRPDVVWLDADAPLDLWKEQIAASPHSRFPVARGKLDELIGVLDTRQILDALLIGNAFDPMAAVVQAPVVHEDTRAPRILEMFKQTGAPLVVVLDEYGGVEGVVTMTDILEALAGELPVRGEEEDPSAVRRDDGSWLMDGLIAIEEVESLTGLSAMGEEGDFHTLAGFVLSQVARLPQIGEKFVWDDWTFEVVDMDSRRVDRVLLTPPQEESRGAPS